MKYVLLLTSIFLISCSVHQDESPVSIAASTYCEDSTFVIFQNGADVKVSDKVPVAAIGNDYESILATIGPLELNLFGEPWVNNVLTRRLPIIGYIYQYPTIYVVFDPDLRSQVYAQRLEPRLNVLRKKQVVRVQQVGTCLVVLKYVDNNTVGTWKPIDPF